LSPVMLIIGRFLTALLFILLAVIIILQYPLAKLTRPLRELASLAAQIGQGNFGAKARISGFGEVSLVSGAFNTMVENLDARDKAIRSLMREQGEKVR